MEGLIGLVIIAVAVMLGLILRRALAMRENLKQKVFRGCFIFMVSIAGICAIFVSIELVPKAFGLLWLAARDIAQVPEKVARTVVEDRPITVTGKDLEREGVTVLGVIVAFVNLSIVVLMWGATGLFLYGAIVGLDDFADLFH